MDKWWLLTVHGKSTKLYCGPSSSDLTSMCQLSTLGHGDIANILPWQNPQLSLRAILRAHYKGSHGQPVPSPVSKLGELSGIG